MLTTDISGAASRKRGDQNRERLAGGPHFGAVESALRCLASRLRSQLGRERRTRHLELPGRAALNNRHQPKLPDLSHQRAGVADVPRALAAFDLRQDRLHQRAGIVGRTRVAPEAGEIDRGAQFEEARLLATGYLDRFEERGFGPCSVGFRPSERDLTIDTVQVGEPEPLPGLLDKGEGVVKHGFGVRHLAPHQQGFGKVGFENGIGEIPAGSIVCGDRAAQRRDVFLRRFAHRASASLIVATPEAKLLHFSFSAKGDMFGGVALGGFEIAVHEFGERQGKLHVERYRAGKFVIGEFAAR